VKYWERWIGDWKKKTARLTVEQKGAYSEMLDYIYANECELPLDREGICRIVGAVSKNEKKSCDFVLENFFKITPTGYMQDRAGEEIAKRHEYAEAQRERANRRWEAERARQQGNIAARANGAHKPAKPVPEPLPLPDWLPLEEWNAWLGMRKQKTNTDDALKLNLKKLLRFKTDGFDPKDILENAIAGGYQGLFAPDRKPPQSKQAKAAAANVALLRSIDYDRK
jgi:uncharacterized protein YdaU (DUF1376 family)